MTFGRGAWRDLASGLLVFALMAAACSGGGTTASNTDPVEGAPVNATPETRPATPSDAPPTPSPIPLPTETVEPSKSADIVVHGGTIWTMDGDRSIADAVAITAREIVAVGADDDILALVGPGTQVIDVAGRMVIPGIVDPHTHVVQVGAPDEDAMLAGQDELVSWGVTTAGMPSVGAEQIDAFRRLDAEGQLNIRSHLYVLYNTVCGDSAGGFHLEHEFTQDPKQRLVVAGAKIFADGGVCNAPAVSFDYLPTVPQDLRDGGWVEHGALYASADEIAATVSEVDAAGGQVVVHGIGDVGIQNALEGLAMARDAGLDRRHRLDHNSLVGLLDAETRALYTAGEVIPVVQLLPWARACEPGRTELWESILPATAVAVIEDRRFISDANPGIVFAWHGDGPYVPAPPLAQMYSAVTGGYADGEGTQCNPWTSVPTVAVVEALAMLTINAAAAMLIDHRVGSIEVGKVADLVVLEHALDHVDPDVGVANNRPLMTMADGLVLLCDVEFCDGPVGLGDTTDPPGGDPTELGWSTVDHPTIERIRASRVHDGDTGAERALDRDSGTSWNSGDSSPQWIEIDLGVVVDVAELRLEIEQDPPGFTIHRIFAGFDPEPSALVAELTGNTSSGQTLTVIIEAPLRYLRIETPDSPAWVAWREIDVITS